MLPASSYEIARLRAEEIARTTRQQHRLAAQPPAERRQSRRTRGGRAVAVTS